MAAFAVETAHARQGQMGTFYTAIRNAAAEFSAGLEGGAAVAVISMGAGYVLMSDHLIDEMIIALVEVGGFAVLDRGRLEQAARELRFSTSLEPAAHAARSIGMSLGVLAVVTGTFEPVDDFYRISVRMIDVQTAAVLGSYTADVRNDNITAFFLGPAGRRPGQAVLHERQAIREFFSLGVALMFDGGRIGSASDGRIGPLGIGGIEPFDALPGMGIGTSLWGIGAGFFVDATFAKLSLGFIGGSTSEWVELHGESEIQNGSFFALDLSLLLKFPFALADGSFSVFPLFGAGYSRVLQTAGIIFHGAMDLSTARLKAGAGGDFVFSERMFARATLLVTYRFAPVLHEGWGVGADTSGGFGASATAGIGFRL
ncbi:MAG: hypothetical protein FWD88_01220 [Treponema sp.]|nr:hypothetical protein [Treponema sp.]